MFIHLTVVGITMEQGSSLRNRRDIVILTSGAVKLAVDPRQEVVVVAGGAEVGERRALPRRGVVEEASGRRGAL